MATVKKLFPFMAALFVSLAAAASADAQGGPVVSRVAEAPPHVIAYPRKDRAISSAVPAGMIQPTMSAKPWPMVTYR